MKTPKIQLKDLHKPTYTKTQLNRSAWNIIGIHENNEKELINRIANQFGNGPKGHQIAMDIIFKWRKAEPRQKTVTLLRELEKAIANPLPYIASSSPHEYYIPELESQFMNELGSVSDSTRNKIAKAVEQLNLKRSTYEWALLNQGNQQATAILDGISRIILGKSYIKKLKDKIGPHIIWTGQTRKDGSHKS